MDFFDRYVRLTLSDIEGEIDGRLSRQPCRDLPVRVKRYSPTPGCSAELSATHSGQRPVLRTEVAEEVLQNSLQAPAKESTGLFPYGLSSIDSYDSIFAALKRASQSESGTRGAGKVKTQLTRFLTH